MGTPNRWNMFNQHWSSFRLLLVNKTEHDVTANDEYAAMEPYEPYTSRVIVYKLNIPRRTAYEFLDDLADIGRIGKRNWSLAVPSGFETMTE